MSGGVRSAATSGENLHAERADVARTLAWVGATAWPSSGCDRPTAMRRSSAGSGSADCSTSTIVALHELAIDNWHRTRSAPRPPSLRVRHACIDFARHVHRLHLSRIRPSGPRLHNPLEHVQRPRLPPDSAPIQTSWSGAGVPLRGADAVVAKDKAN